MLVYKTFFKVARRYIKSTLVYLIVFIVILLFMTKLGDSSVSNKFQSESVDFVVIDNDNSTASQALIKYLESKHRRIELNNTDPESLEDNLYNERIYYVMYIDKGFEEKLKTGQTKDILSYTMKTDGAKGYFFKQDVNAYLDTVRLYLTAEYDLEDALNQAYDTATAANSSNVKTVSFGNLEGTKDKNSSYMGYFFKYLAYVVLGALTLTFSTLLMSFHKKDLKERLAISATSERKQKAAIGLGSLTICLVFWLFLILLAVIMFGADSVFSANGLRNLLNSLIFIMVVLTISLVLGSFDLDESVTNFITNIIGLGSGFLCGVFVPIWYLSKPLQIVARFFPTYWYINNCDMLSGASGQAFTSQIYWTNIGIQFIFILAIFSVYLLINNTRKRKLAI